MTNRAQDQKERESLVESHWAYQGKIVKLRLDTFDLGNDQRKVFELVSHSGAVVIIPIDPKGRLLLVQQWRRSIGQVILELPAGKLEKGEDPLFCAQRELQEEIGQRAQKMTGLHGFYSAPGFCNEYLHLFLGEDLIPDPLAQDDDEAIDVIPLELPVAIRLIEEGKIMDAKTIAGILRYQLLKR